MAYQPIPVTENTLKIRQEYLKMPVAMEDNPYIDRKYRHFCTGDRWLSLEFLEGYLAAEKAETTRRRRSYAEAAELLNAKPIITDHEILAGHVYFPEYTPEQRKRYDELSEMFRMSAIPLAVNCPRTSHLAMDLDKLLRVGVEGLIAEIKEKEFSLDLNDENVYPEFDVIKKYDFYESALLELNAVLDLEKRYAESAREMAEKAEGKRKNELLRMADALDQVPAKPARGFFEAIQSVQFYLGTLFGLYTLNRPDRYLYPYYKKDLEEGRITREEAQELIDNFLLHVSTRVFSRAACGFIVGGRRPDGTNVENDLTFMFLTALDHIRMPDPNGALAVNKDTSDEILSYAREVLSHGVTHPAFYNDDVIISSLTRYGVPYEEAVCYIHTTCAEISVIGKTKAHTTSSTVALPVMLKEAVKDLNDDASFDEIFDLILVKTRDELRKKGFYYFERLLEASRNGFDYMRISCLIDDCIEKGQSIYDGGARYSFLQPIIVGFSTAVDSLIAIKKLVYEEKRFTLSEFTKIVESDFENNEALRQYIINKLPHYGNDEETADEMAKRMGNAIQKLFDEGKMMGAKIMMPGTFSYINHASLGAKDTATYDGRRAYTSYSDGCGPVQGRDTNGPTAMVLSMTSWDQSRFLSGMVINIKFSPSHLTDAYNDSFVSMLRAFIERGGMEMQVNVVDRATLEDAKIHPEAHKDLIVRIGGYSDYFIRLTPALQDEVIQRTEH